MEPKTVVDARERATKDESCRIALRSSLKHYQGCPACGWTGIQDHETDIGDAVMSWRTACGYCGLFRVEFDVDQCAELRRAECA